ncbi:MAG: hypothetical protein LBM02_05875 [Lachnospiraceae bacterium]|nr:hypothetical protein [Lachnospiraceae bacterium]
MKDFIRNFGTTNEKIGPKRTLKRVVVFLLIFAILIPFVLKEKIEINAAPAAGQISYSIKYNSGSTEKWTFQNVAVGAVPSGFSGYSSINILYPKKFTFKYSTPSGWDIRKSGSNYSDYDSISIHFNNQNPTNIRNFFTSANTYFVLVKAKDYPIHTNAKVQITLETSAVAQYIDPKGNPHWYQRVPDSNSNWFQAFNKARRMSHNGIKGHLATITSIEEQVFVYKSISSSPGWLGGTRAIYKNGSFISTTKSGNISENVNDYEYGKSANKWYWADGPDAGTVFYNSRTHNSTNGPVTNVFNFFSNGDTYTNYYSTYSSEFEFKNYPQEPNGMTDGKSSSESCLQFAQLEINKYGTFQYATWNDLHPDYKGDSLQCFYVEFTGAPKDLIGSYTFKSPVFIPLPIKVDFKIQNSLYSTSLSTQELFIGDKVSNPTTNLVPGTVYSQYGNKKFLGWFIDAAATKPYDFNALVTDTSTSFTLYGGWKQMHTIDASYGLHGSLDQNGSILVAEGDSLTINMLPDTGYHPSEVLVDGNDVGSVMSYTFANVTTDHTINVNFVANDVIVKVDKDGNPWSNSGKNLILHDTNAQSGTGNIALSANADNSYGASIIPNGTYEVLEGNKDTGKHVVVNDNSPVATVVNYYTFTSSAGEGGDITGTSSGSIFLPGEQVTVGADVFPHYSWNTWTLTGTGASSLSLVDTSKQTISFSMPEGAVNAAASFIHITWKINTFAGPNGSVSPDGETTMFDGTDLPITITPDTGYHVEKVLVDGFNLGELYNYTFANITANGILQAEFTPNVVKVEVTKDGKIWANSGKRIYLHLAGDESATPIELEVDTDSANGNGYITKTVPNGIYEIYDGDVDTGETVTVLNNNPDSVEVSLYVITTTAGKNGEIISKDSKLNPLEGKNRYNSFKASGNEIGKDGNVSKTIKFSNNRLLKNISNEILILKGFSQSFDIVPGRGYYVDKVYVNGKYSGYETSYRFDNIQQSQTLEATFMSEKQDSDGDGVPDYLERIRGTDPYKAPLVRTTKKTTTATTTMTTTVTNSKKTKVKTGDINKTLPMGIMFLGSLMVIVFGGCWKRKKRGR